VNERNPPQSPPAPKSRPLDSQPCRALTDREVANLLGGLIGCLVQGQTDAGTVRRAVRWWADNDEPWAFMTQNMGEARLFAEKTWATHRGGKTS
jgi:hypothetical protein